MVRRQALVLFSIGGLLLFTRLLTLGLSDFGDSHGFNEAVYYDIAQSYRAHPTAPAYSWGVHVGQPWFYDTPPLTTYAIAASHTLFGANEWATRLPSWIALVGACLGAATLAGTLNKQDKALARATGFALATATPWLLAWGGRAQTDIYLAAAAVWAVAGMANHDKRWGPWAVFASTTLGLLAKQTFPLVFVAAVFLPDKRQALRHLWLPTLAGIAINAAWWFWQWTMHPVSVMASIDFHLNRRAAPFANWPLTLVWGILLGMAPLFQAAGRRPRHWLALAPALVFLAFALENAPLAHQYYTLPAAPLLAGAAGAVLAGRRLVWPALAIGILVTAALMATWGDFGSHRVEEIGNALPADGEITAPAHIAPQLRVYSGRDILAVQTWQPDPTGWIVTYGLADCPLIHESRGHGPPIRLYDCT